MSSTVESSRPSVAVIVAPVLIVLIGIGVVLGAALVIALYTHRANRRMLSCLYHCFS